MYLSNGITNIHSWNKICKLIDKIFKKSEFSKKKIDKKTIKSKYFH